MYNLGEKYLITTNGWFYAPDGKQYRAVHGIVRAINNDSETLGIKTNRGSTNWFVEIGNMIVAGCQIHYVIKTDCVNTDDVTDLERIDGKLEEKTHSCRIYLA